MAETLVKTEICEACGVDVRPGSMFCYNCGGAVVAVESGNSRKKKKKNKVSDVWFQDEIGVNNNLNTTKLDKIAEEKPVEESAEVAENDAESIPKPTVSAEVKLKSAAELRRKSKTFQQKKVEVVWEENENTPSAWFVLVALVLVLFVVLIFLAAIYLK
jgi:hypothetical protein